MKKKPPGLSFRARKKLGLVGDCGALKKKERATESKKKRKKK